jgi:hypothetical protein
MIAENCQLWLVAIGHSGGLCGKISKSLSGQIEIEGFSASIAGLASNRIGE